MKGRGWIALGAMALLVMVLVLLRGSNSQGQSPNHASTSDAVDGTSALRAYADALGYPSGSVEGTFSLPTTSGLLFVFTPSNGFSADQVAQLNSWMQSGGVVVYAAEEGDPQLDTQFGLRRSGTGVPANSIADNYKMGWRMEVSDDGQWAHFDDTGGFTAPMSRRRSPR